MAGAKRVAHRLNAWICFAPHSTVTIAVYSAPQVLGTAVTDAFGNFSKPVTVPLGLAVEPHSMIASGLAPDGSPRSMKLLITVADAADPTAGTHGLPVTGTPVPAVVTLGLLLVAAGTGQVTTGRTRWVRA